MPKLSIVSVSLWIFLTAVGGLAQQPDRVKPYLDVLKDRGRDPVAFILDKLNDYDLILFDDALHTAVEPFEFYQDLVRNAEFQAIAPYLFLEAVSVNQQTALDAYLQSEVDDVELLYPAFQNDFSGTGWPYQTYFALLQSIWKVNHGLPEESRIKVLAVNAPTYWKEIHSPTDVDLFRRSLEGNDYTMYSIIRSYLDRFRSGRKGIFLTNTRHAYKGIKNRENEYYWNCGTFFTQRYPGKTYSVRCHNITLRLAGMRESDPGGPRTTEGLEDVVVEWARMEDGLWDYVFKQFGNKSVAFDLRGTPYGTSDYIGNHMLNVVPGQTMYDAYDALIFLAPIETLRQTAMVDFIYTVKFKAELERRVRFLYTEQQIEEYLQGYGANSIREFIDGYFTDKPQTLQPLAQDIGPIDAWMSAD